jgi:hypothetical protein
MSSHSLESQYEMLIHRGVITIFQHRSETNWLPEGYSIRNFTSCRGEPCSNLLIVTARELPAYCQSPHYNLIYQVLSLQPGIRRLADGAYKPIR